MSVAKWLCMIPFAALFLVSGVLHFATPRFYLQIVPPFLPWPEGLVAISGACELLGAVGLFIPATRPWAAFGLAALLVAVFPANVYMAWAGMRFGGAPLWVSWARLPLQIPLIACAVWLARA